MLITSTIIGVIAALTIPNLMHKYEEHKALTQLKATYSILTNAVEQAKKDYGPYEEWDFAKETNAQLRGEKLGKTILEYVKVGKYCGNTTECFAKKYTTLTNGNYKSSDSPNSSNNFAARATLNNGSSILFWSDPNYTDPHYVNFIGIIEIDINGPSKPNQAGIDLFEFPITQKRIIPRGAPDDPEGGWRGTNMCDYSNDKHTGRNGIGCTAWALYKGNMDYRRKLISW